MFMLRTRFRLMALDLLGMITRGGGGLGEQILGVLSLVILLVRLGTPQRSLRTLTPIGLPRTCRIRQGLRRNRESEFRNETTKYRSPPRPAGPYLQYLNRLIEENRRKDTPAKDVADEEYWNIWRRNKPKPRGRTRAKALSKSTLEAIARS